MLVAKRKQSCMRSFENWERVERLKCEHLTALLTAGFHSWEGTYGRKVSGLVERFGRKDEAHTGADGVLDPDFAKDR